MSDNLWCPFCPRVRWDKADPDKLKLQRRKPRTLAEWNRRYGRSA